MEVAQEASQRGDEQLGTRAAQALGLAHDEAAVVRQFDFQSLYEPFVVYNMIFLADLGDYQAMNEVYGSYFPENPPARACVQAGLVKPEFLVEVAATAVIDS